MVSRSDALGFFGAKGDVAHKRILRSRAFNHGLACATGLGLEEAIVTRFLRGRRRDFGWDDQDIHGRKECNVARDAAEGTSAQRVWLRPSSHYHEIG